MMAKHCDDCNGVCYNPADHYDDALVYECGRCESVVCLECRRMDRAGNDYCADCANAKDAEDPLAFKLWA